MRYIVTGATGAVGSAVVQRLLESNPGDQIRVFVRSEHRFREQFPDAGVEIAVGNALVPIHVRRAVRGADVIFHCINFPLTNYYHALESARLLVTAIGDSDTHLVYPGNTWVFGSSEPPITPETPIDPPSRVAKIKAEADDTFARAPFSTTVVHLPDFYGPRVVNDLVRPLFERPIEGRNVLFPAPVDVPHQFIFVEDAARALVAVADAPPENRPSATQPVANHLTVNHATADSSTADSSTADRPTADYTAIQRFTVGTTPITVREFVRRVYEVADTDGRIMGLPSWMVEGGALFSERIEVARDILHTFTHDTTMSGDAIRDAVGFEPEVGYDEGIRRTVEWFREETA